MKPVSLHQRGPSVRTQLSFLTTSTDGLDDYLSVKEVAAILRLHQNTVYRLVKEELLEATQYGRQWRISKNAIHNGLKRRDDDE